MRLGPHGQQGYSRFVSHLPITAICAPLLAQLQTAPTVILTAPPGAGKSTYLPLFLLQSAEFAGKRIVMLEPRRLAAKSIASYLATQLGEEVGQTVGYQIRLEQAVSAATRLLIVTEGVLIRKILADAELSSVDLLIFDEFHERSLQTDLALSLALDVQQLNERLQLLIMSATLDTELLSAKLQAPVLASQGRSFPVDIRYVTPDQSENWLQTAQAALHASRQHDGSVLVFLPGQREINLAQAYLIERNTDPQLDIYALLGSLSLREQQAAIAPSPAGRRKVVLATNVAETSLTIDGISVVVDSGQARAAVYQAKLGFSRLDTMQISQASAIQRAGRAGRLMPGVCYRIDSAEKWQRRAKQTVPDILQADLLALRLDIARWGASVSSMFWLDAPPRQALQSAEQTLQLLGALDAKGQLTAFGNAMGALPVEPRIAAMLLHSKDLELQGDAGAVALACLVAAVLEQGVRATAVDLQGALRLSTDMARQHYRQLCRLLQATELDTRSLPLQLLAPLLSRAFPDRIALRRGQGYLLANGCGATLPADDSLLGSEILVVVDLRVWQQQSRISVAVPWTLDGLCQHWHAQLQWHTQAGFDQSNGRFVAEQQLRLGQLVLKRKSVVQDISAADRRAAWLDFIMQQGLDTLTWSPQVRQLQHRVALARQLQPSVAWPDLSDDALLLSLSEWLGPYVGEIKSVAMLKQLDVAELLRYQLSYQEQQQLDALLPTHWCSVLGTQVALAYSADGDVSMQIRLQEMFGQAQTPTVANGAVAVTIELLSPARRPLQVTRDLASFWQNAYDDVKKEMRGRYPKHYWPDDPQQAQPTNKTKKAMEHDRKTNN